MQIIKEKTITRIEIVGQMGNKADGQQIINHLKNKFPNGYLLSSGRTNDPRLIHVVAESL